MSSQVLLIVDMISDYAFPDAEHVVVNVQEAVPAVRRAREIADAAGVRVVYVNDILDDWRCSRPPTVRRPGGRAARSRRADHAARRRRLLLQGPPLDVLRDAAGALPERHRTAPGGLRRPGHRAVHLVLGPRRPRAANTRSRSCGTRTASIDDDLGRAALEMLPDQHTRRDRRRGRLESRSSGRGDRRPAERATCTTLCTQSDINVVHVRVRKANRCERGGSSFLRVRPLVGGDEAALGQAEEDRPRSSSSHAVGDAVAGRAPVAARRQRAARADLRRVRASPSA